MTGLKETHDSWKHRSELPQGFWDSHQSEKFIIPCLILRATQKRAPLCLVIRSLVVNSGTKGREGLVWVWFGFVFYHFDM